MGNLKKHDIHFTINLLHPAKEVYFMFCVRSCLFENPVIFTNIVSTSEMYVRVVITRMKRYNKTRQKVILKRSYRRIETE